MKTKLTLTEEEALDKLQVFLECACEEELIILYEEFVDSCPDCELTDNDFDIMFCEVDNILDRDYQGEMVKFTKAFELIFGLKFIGVDKQANLVFNQE